MGHVIDPNGYNKAFLDQEYAAEEYLKAEPWLNIISEDPENVPVREFNRLSQELEETKRRIQEAEWLIGDPEVAALLKQLLEERKQTATF
jgi:putative heme iron utilization protein